MANMKEILPKGEYKIKTVGPPRNWEYNGTAMTTDSIQFEGHEQYWVDVNRKSETPAPTIGTSLNGHIEQDDQGKYPPKFKKEQGAWAGGGGRGPAVASPGAIWSTAMATAAQIVAGYYAASGTKPADLKEYFGKVKTVAPKVNAAVDAFVAANKPAEKPADTVSSEAGETQAPAQTQAPVATDKVVIEDISDDELGEW
jgi:hypothetical protein